MEVRIYLLGQIREWSSVEAQVNGMEENLKYSGTSIQGTTLGITESVPWIQVTLYEGYKCKD